MPLALLALTLSAFAIGTTEFVIVGLIPTMAQDLQVSLPSAGLLVSLYALGVAVGAPVLTALTGNWNRKHVLLAVMTLFVAGNVLAWQAPSYETLIAARVITGLAHGVFFSIGSTIAHWTGTKGKSGQRHCNYVYRTDRRTGNRSAPRDLYRPEFGLAIDLFSRCSAWPYRFDRQCILSAEQP